MTQSKTECHRRGTNGKVIVVKGLRRDERPLQLQPRSPSTQEGQMSDRPQTNCADVAQQWFRGCFHVEEDAERELLGVGKFSLRKVGRLVWSSEPIHRSIPVFVVDWTHCWRRKLVRKWIVDSQFGITVKFSTWILWIWFEQSTIMQFNCLLWCLNYRILSFVYCGYCIISCHWRNTRIEIDNVWYNNCGDLYFIIKLKNWFCIFFWFKKKYNLYRQRK